MGFTASKASERGSLLRGPRPFGTKAHCALKCALHRDESPMSVKRCSSSVLLALCGRLILFIKRCCVRQNSYCRWKRAAVPPGVFTVHLRRAPRCRLSSAVMQMLKRAVFIYKNTRGSPQGSVILFVINPSAGLLLTHNQALL